MKKYEIILVSAFLFLVPLTTIQAQSTFAPDRPGLGDGAYVVQPGVLYAELGIEYYEGGAAARLSLGQLMFRYGLVRNVELRLSINSFVIGTGAANGESGFTDPGLGMKIELFNDSDSPLTLSGLVSVSIPMGYSPVTDNGWDPSAALLADYQISEYWSVNTNLGYTLTPRDEPNQFMFTFTPGFTIAGSKYGGYFGYAAFISSANSRHFIEAGITRLVGDNIQLDINGGLDVSSGNFFIGAGFAVRL